MNRAFAALGSRAVALTPNVTGELQASSAEDELATAQRLASKGAFEDSVVHLKRNWRKIVSARR